MTVDNYELITNKIVEIFENVEDGKWEKPWNTAGGFPRNASSQTQYQGINVLMLWAAQMEAGYSSNEWVTFNQAKAMGGMVRKGESGTKIMFFTIAKKNEKDENDDDEKTKTFPMLRVWTVFNRDQVDGLPEQEKAEALSEIERIENAEAFIDNTGATLQHGGERAAYSPKRDLIMMPVFEDFVSSDRYYTTLLHELGHWTGHPTRLNRDLTGRFGDESYAAEELIAELTSAFVAADLGIETDLMQPGEYIKSWIRVLKNDKYAIFTAARHAQDAAKTLHNKPEDEEDDVTSNQATA